MMTLDYSLIFLAVSLFVGVGLAIQMSVLYRTNGKMPEMTAFYWFSTLDAIWFFACLFALYFLELDSLQKSIPLAFITYSILSFFYASANIEGMPTRPEDIVFAKPYMSFGLSFALVFITWTTIVLLHSIHPLAWLNFL